jgi:hypothetical protein
MWRKEGMLSQIRMFAVGFSVVTTLREKLLL